MMTSIFDFQRSLKSHFRDLCSKFKKREGFTLIELLIFMGIFSILIVVLFQLFVAVFDVQLESQSTSAVAQDGRYIVNKLSYDIKNSTSSAILSPAAGSTGQTLVIASPATTYTYSLSNGNLDIHDSALNTTDQLNSINTQVSSISFFRLSDTSNQYSTITVSITVISKVIRRGGVNSENFNFTTGTR